MKTRKDKWRAYYLAHKDEKIARKRDRKKEMRDKLAGYKEGKPCMDCHQIFHPVCMDFDHRVPSEKVMGLSSAANKGWSWERILTEIAKCDLVCANCHRKRTFHVS